MGHPLAPQEHSLYTIHYTCEHPPQQRIDKMKEERREEREKQKRTDRKGAGATRLTARRNSSLTRFSCSPRKQYAPSSCHITTPARGTWLSMAPCAGVRGSILLVLAHLQVQGSGPRIIMVF
jgi:hypothetical protein